MSLNLCKKNARMSGEAGKETATNYRFQYLYVALLAMQMYNKNINFVELICEDENDVAAKDKNGKFTSYQITRSDYIRTIPKGKIIKSLQGFLELFKDRRYSKFYLISSQCIADIVTKVGVTKRLTDEQIERYSKELKVDKDNKECRKCFDKIFFRIIPDTLGLERLLHKEIVYAYGDISNRKVNCIMEGLIGLVQRCSRASYREESCYYTSNEENSTEQLKKATSTIKDSDISEIGDGCMNIPILENEEKNEVRDEKLQEHDNKLIDQCIDEANEKDEKIAYTALIFLEHLGINMKIYNSRKLLSFLKKCINDDEKIGYLSFYLDLIRRMLHTSIALDKDYTFLNYVKKNYKRKIVDIICSLDYRYGSSSKQSALQIIDEYEIISAVDRNELYLRTLIECVQKCTDEQYQPNLQYLIIRVPHNIPNIVKIRKQLTTIKKSSNSDIILRRCDDLLNHYK